MALVRDTGTTGDRLTRDSTLKVTGLEAGSTWQYSLDGGKTWSKGSGDTITGLTGDGQKTVQVRQTDAAGNTSPAASLTFTLDTRAAAAPVLVLAKDTGTAGDKLTRDGSLKVLNLDTGAGVSWEYSLDGGKTWVKGSGNTITGITGDGQKTVQVRQTDAAGNVSPVATLTFTLDATADAAPTLALVTDSGIAGDRVSRDGKVKVNGLVAGSTWEYSLDGGTTWLAGTGDTITGITGDGQKSVQVRQTDRASNVSPAATLTFTLDTTSDAAPSLALAADSGTAGDLLTNDGTLRVTGLEAGSTWEYSLDNGITWLAGTGDTITGITGDGQKTVQVRQTDAAGNTSQPASYTFTLDTTAPAAPVFQAADDAGGVKGVLADNQTTDDRRPELSGTGAAGDVIRIYDNGILIATTTVGADGTWRFTPANPLADGAHRLTVTATDTAGNVSPASAPLNIIIASTAVAPSLNLVSDTGTAGDLLTNDGTVKVTGLEAGGTWEYSLDGGTTWLAGTGDTITGITGDGEKTVLVRQTNAAGDVSPVASIAFTLDTAAAVPALAPNQAESLVNTTTAGTQDNTSVTALADGWLVTWQGVNPADGTTDIYQQRYNADGTKNGAETVVNTTVAGNNSEPSVTTLNDGGWVVTWQGTGANGTTEIYQQRYNADGTKNGTETVVNTTVAGNQITPSVTLLPDGGWLVSWEGVNPSNGTTDIYQQRYNADGTKNGAETVVNTAIASRQEKPSVTVLADGGWVVTWEGFQTGSMEIYQQRYNADGTKNGGETRVNTTTTGHQYYKVVAALNDGGWVVTWEDTATREIFQQRYNADGARNGGETLVTFTTNVPVGLIGTDVPHSVKGLNDGGWVVTWQSDTGEIYQQRYNADGTSRGAETQVNTTTAGNQSEPSVTTLNDGGWVVTWQSDGDIYQQRYNTGGEKVDSHMTIKASDNVGAKQGPLTDGETTDDNTLDLSGELSGMLLNGQEVLVFDGDILLGKATVTNTSWSFTTEVLGEGVRNLSIKLRDSTGTTLMSSEEFRVNVDATPL